MDRVLFKKIYDEYHTQVRKTLYYMYGGENLDDLVQEVFIKIWNKYDSFNENSTLKTWILAITRNTAIDMLRKKGSIKITTFEGHENDYKAPDDTVKLSTGDLITKSLAEMDDKKREVIIYHYLMELTLEEISEITDAPLGTIKSRLHNARTQLERILNKKGAML